MTTPYRDELLTHSWLGAWPLDETDGSTVDDISGEDNHGTVTGADLTTPGLLVESASAAWCDGVDDDINAGAIGFSGNALTVACWVRTNDPGGTGGNSLSVIDRDPGGSTSSQNRQMQLRLSAGRPEFIVFLGADARTVLASSSIADGKIHHVVGTVTPDGSDRHVHLYVDGSEVASGTWTGDLHDGGTTSLRIGDGIAEPLRGAVDFPSYGSIALTSTEVGDLYAAGDPAPPGSVTLDAQAIDGLDDDDLIDVWEDSESGDHAEMSGTSRPAYRAEGISDLPSVDFSAGNRALRHRFGYDMVGGTLFVVFEHSSTSLQQVVSNVDENHQVRVEGSGTTLAITGAPTLGSPSVSGVQLDTPHIAEAWASDTQSQVLIDGTASTVESHSVAQWMLNQLGRRGSSNEPLTGLIAEVRYIPEVLDASAREAIRDELHAKWIDPGTIPVGQAVETEQAQPIAVVQPQVVLVGQAVETEAAQPVTVVGPQTILVGQAVETEVAQPVTPTGPIVVAVGQAVETETAFAISTGLAQTILVGQAVESETARTVETLAPDTVLVGQAVETEAGQAIAVVRTVTLEQALEEEHLRRMTVRPGVKPPPETITTRDLDTVTVSVSSD